MTGLIISAGHDIHAFAVQLAGKELGYNIEIIDTAEYLAEFDLLGSFGGILPCHAIIKMHDGNEIDSRNISGLWWRRPATPDLNHLLQHPGSLEAAKAEASHALFGSLSATIPNSFNQIALSRLASQKPLQLKIASEIGLRVPRTIITSSPKEAEEFLRSNPKGVIYKLFKGTDLGFFETRKLKLDDINDLWRLRLCPVLLQEYIQGTFDIRVTIVKSKLFAARIDFDEQSVDSRFTTKKITSLELPATLEKQLISLVSSFGLMYGTIDLRFSELDGFTFFEINPEGQYLWTEIEANLEISQAIAKVILNVDD